MLHLSEKTALRISFLAVLSLTATVGRSNPQETRPVDYVDPFIGTTKLGNTFPAVCLPFGLAKWTPQTRAGERKGVKPYDYTDSLFQGVRWTNFMSGSAVPDYGSMTLMPLAGRLITDPVQRSSRYDHASELARPYYYRIHLPDYNVNIEVAATTRAGIFRITFPSTDSAFVLLQPNNTPLAPHQKPVASVRIIPERREVVGSNPAFRFYIATGQPAGFSGHFVARFNTVFSDYGVWDRNEGLRKRRLAARGQPGAYVRFDARHRRTVLVKIGCSFTSIDEARRNLDAEIPDWDFGRVVEEGRQAWQKALSVVEVEGGSQSDLRTFYTALYHALLLPRVFSDADGSYVGFDGDDSVHVARDFVYYDDYSLWDTFRAEHPLLLLIQPQRVRDWVRSLLAKAEQGGWLPIFPAWNSYTTEMIGDHGISMITDAFVKGFRDFDVQEAFRFMLKNAKETPPRPDYLDGKGRRALTSYLRYGYIPLEDPVREAFHKGEQVSRTLEYAYDDFCLAVLADSLGDAERARTFKHRARNYRNVFDPETGFVRGRHQDGSWVKPFDPSQSVPYITEATPWVYTFFVPHDVAGLVRLMGGRQAFIAKLDSLFDKDFYAHDNEPSHHIPYLYAFAGAPWKTQERVSQALRANYADTPSGLSGNDDAGQMSAWYLFSAMGFYPSVRARTNTSSQAPSSARSRFTCSNLTTRARFLW